MHKLDGGVADAFYRDPQEAREMLRFALQQCGGHTTKAARKLGMATPSLWHWLRKLEMDKEPQAIRLMLSARYRLTDVPRVRRRKASAR